MGIFICILMNVKMFYRECKFVFIEAHERKFCIVKFK